MNILQSHQGDIPEQEDEKEQDQTGEDYKPDEDPLFGCNLQKNLQPYCGMRIAECITPSQPSPLEGEGEGEGGNLLMKDSAARNGMPGKKIPDDHSSLPL